MILDRTKNVKRGSLWGMIYRIVSLILPFITRTVLIKAIGVDYLGLSGLFTSILNLLNMTELGIGTAIVYSMYKPIAEDDGEKICALMNLYKRVYRYIGVFVLIIGLCLLPFLPNLVHGEVPSDVNLYVLYLIYLSNSVVTYWLFAYKNCLLQAFQRVDVINIIGLIINVCIYGLQIFVLICLRNYYAYVIINPILQITSNCLTAYVVSRIYPEYVSKGDINKEEKSAISRHVAGLMMDKMALMLRHSFGNIIVSTFIGLTLVAIYSNYLYIITAVGSFFTTVTVSMAAGIGNSIASSPISKNKSDFAIINFVYLSFAYFAFVLLLCCFQPFMKLWVGENLTLPTTAMILFSIMFIIDRNGNILGLYYDAAGLWWQGKWKGLIQAIIIIITSIIGGKFYGIIGVLVANVLTGIIANLSLTLYYLNKCYFKGAYWTLLLHDLFILSALVLAGIFVFIIVNRISTQLHINLVLDLALRVILGCILSLSLYLILFNRTKIFKLSWEWLKIHIRQ